MVSYYVLGGMLPMLGAIVVGRRFDRVSTNVEATDKQCVQSEPPDFSKQHLV